MRVWVRLLEEQAELCLKLAYQSKSKKAERLLRLLAVDLMLAAEKKRARLPRPVERKTKPEQKPEAGPAPAASAAESGKLSPEMLRQLEALRLVVGADALPV